MKDPNTTPSKLLQPTRIKASFPTVIRSAKPTSDAISKAIIPKLTENAPNHAESKATVPIAKRKKTVEPPQTLYKNQSLISSTSCELELLKKRICDLECKSSSSTTFQSNILLVNQLESKINMLQVELQAAQERLESKECKNRELIAENSQLKEKCNTNESKEQLITIQNESSQLKLCLDNLTASYKDKLDALEKNHSFELEALRNEHLENTMLLQSDFMKKSTQMQTEKNLLTNQASSLEEALKLSNAKCASLSLDLSRLSLEIATLQSDHSKLSSEYSKSVSLCDSLSMSNEMLNLKLRQAESVRRRLFNEVQELKGNIRVFCRIKPIAPSSPSALSPSIEDANCVYVNQRSESATSAKTARLSLFSFDRVFSADCSQAAVWDEVSQLVQSALDGYRVCIFAYGQTGSGKTFTMEGDISNGDLQGIIPRSINEIFHAIESYKPLGWSYTVDVSFLEIYNETIRDLLSDSQAIAAKPIAKSYDIKHTPAGTLITDLIVPRVQSVEEVHELLHIASKNRTIGGTLCNERSSRSHSVFTLKLSGTNSITGECCEGLLNLIDLAGSERLSQSGATGDRLKETQAINKSLSSLADVIVAIANQQEHIPYRNSKLTYLLQGSLGNSNGCKMLMFVNVAQGTESVGESLCSLRFATKVNSCKIGTAKRSVK